VLLNYESIAIETEESKIHFNALAFSGMRYSELQWLYENPDSLGFMCVNLTNRFVPLSSKGYDAVRKLLICPFPLPHNNTFNENLKRWTRMDITTTTLRRNWEQMLMATNIRVFSTADIFLTDKDKIAYIQKCQACEKTRLVKPKYITKEERKFIETYTFDYRYLVRLKDVESWRLKDTVNIFGPLRRYLAKEYSERPFRVSILNYDWRSKASRIYKEVTVEFDGEILKFNVVQNRFKKKRLGDKHKLGIRIMNVIDDVYVIGRPMFGILDDFWKKHRSEFKD